MQGQQTRLEWIRATLERFETPLSRYALRLLVDPDRARDAVQETFLALCQADRSRIEPHLAAWLFRVCRNRALDMRRKENRVEPLAIATEQQLTSLDPGPGVAAETQQGANQVLALVGDLPDNQREVIYLRFGSGLSYREISEVTSNSVSNVGVLIHTAVTKVRERLAQRERRAAMTAAGRSTR